VYTPLSDDGRRSAPQTTLRQGLTTMAPYTPARILPSGATSMARGPHESFGNAFPRKGDPSLGATRRLRGTTDRGSGTWPFGLYNAPRIRWAPYLLLASKPRPEKVWEI
jgi:hypothetical protein